MRKSMQMAGIKKKAMALLLLGGIILTTVFSGQVIYAASQKDNRVLKVGYIGYEGFIYPNEEGEMEGYCVEYLDTIGKYAGLEYEYIACTWAEGLEMLRNKELDLVCNAFYSEERAKEFDFSSQNFGRVRGVLYTRENNTDMYYEDYSNFNGKKIGIIDGSLNIGMLEEYAQRHGFVYEVVLYGTDAEMEEALRTGEVDIIATEQMNINVDLKLVGVYGSQSYYLMSYKGNDFMSDIDDAMMEIYVGDYDYEAALYDKYYGEANRKHALCFTREEMEYIEQNPTIKVGMLPGLYPLSYCNDETGEADGIYAAILDELSKISGLNLEKVVMGAEENPVSMVGTEGKYDMSMSAVDERTATETNNIVLSDSFMDSSIGIVGRLGLVYNVSATYKVAVNDRFVSLHNYLREDYPQYEMVFYETDEECLYAVLNGKADIMMQNVYVINYLLQKPAFENLQLVPTTALLSSNSFIVGADADPRLVSVLNKAIDYFSEDDLNRIIIHDATSNLYEYNWRDFMDKYRQEIISAGSLIVVCVALLVMLNVTRHKNYAMMQMKNEQLREAVDQTMRANQSKSDFFARVSHEIRTPINAIVGITEIAKKTADNESKTRESLDKIETSSKVLLSIVNDILDMSAIENAKMKIADEVFELEGILDGLQAIYGTQCKNKGVTFSVESDVKEKVLKGDSLRVNQVLLNLVSNAYKFTSFGGAIKVSVRELGSHKGVTNLRFTVEDSGEGMSEDTLKRLFLPFEQASSTTAHKHGGSGLGMPIAKNLVDMMGGQIEVESRLGEGTKFIVDIPFQLVETVSDETQKEEAKKEIPLEQLKFGGKKILLAEDNEINREIAIDILEIADLQVEVACDGKEAVEVFLQSEEGRYSAILMDVQMPEMNGYEATKAIRKSDHPQAKSIPIIAMTANSFTEDITAAMSAGMDGHVPKPIDTEVLYRTLWREMKC